MYLMMTTTKTYDGNDYDITDIDKNVHGGNDDNDNNDNYDNDDDGYDDNDLSLS